MTTAGTILHYDVADIAARTAGTLNATGAVVRLPPDSQAAVTAQLRSAFAALHDIKIRDLLCYAMQASKTLVNAGRDSLARNAPQHVHINGYQLPSEYAPELDVLVNGAPVATVHFRLEITLECLNFDGVVEHGRLVQFGSEVFRVVATLSAEGRTLASREAQLDLRLELPLPPGGLPVVPTR